jgi:hypothetical protein
MLLPKSISNISNCCGADRAKYPLDTVQLSRDDAGNALAVATDGRRTIVAKWQDKVVAQDYSDASAGEANIAAKADFEVLVPTKPFDEIFKAVPKKCKAAALEHVLLPESEVGKNIPLETRDDDGAVRRLTAKAIPESDGKFPDWRTAVPNYALKPSDPESKTAVRIRLDAELLAELVKTVWVTAGKSSTYIDLIVPENQLQPVEIRSHNEEGVKVTGFLFPINSPDTLNPFPGALPANKPELKPTNG